MLSSRSHSHHYLDKENGRFPQTARKPSAADASTSGMPYKTPGAGLKTLGQASQQMQTVNGKTGQGKLGTANGQARILLGEKNGNNTTRKPAQQNGKGKQNADGDCGAIGEALL